MSTNKQEGAAMNGVEALLATVASGTVLPALTERVRLREAAGLTPAAVAQALGTRAASVLAWEAGRSEPTGERLDAYRALLEGLARHYPPPTLAPAWPTSAPTTERAAMAPVPAAAVGNTPTDRGTAKRTARAEAGPITNAAPATGTDTRLDHGPLLVLDGDGCAYGTDGLVLDCPATSVAGLVEWTFAEAGIGSQRLHPSGKDGDPLVVLTAAAAERLGLPERLTDRVGLRLDDKHPVITQLTKAKWQLTKRGFGPWPRIYRPAESGRRRCVQLAILPWEALDTRAWGETAHELPAPELARMLGTFAARVITPVGGAASTGIELMTALRPPTHAVRDTSGTWRSAALPGSLPVPVDPAPPEATPEHPRATGRAEGPAGALEEESLAWFRDPELLTDAECALPFAVGIDVNTAYLAAASRLRVGLGEAVHVDRPAFDKKLAGSWLVDLTSLHLDPRLPNPFTPTGEAPTGPAWYATPTLTYALELAALLGQPFTIQPLEAWLRPDAAQLRDLISAYRLQTPPAPWEPGGDQTALERLGLDAYRPEFLGTVPRFAAGPYLDPWYNRLRAAYLDTMADLGVTPDLNPADYLAAMRHHKTTDPTLAAVLSAIKATVKGGVGKLRERPQQRGTARGAAWPALRRTTWNPHIRATLIATANANNHRKIMNLALKAGLYPLAVNVDCVLYASSGSSPLDVLPHDQAGKPLPGGFRLGVSPGMVKHEGTRELVWAAQLLDEGRNPARLVKGPDALWDGE
ncbi:telomere-associated protein Tap [Streptacidiphilus fuscans]|uniref:telomere-associated protein Tap n=1 Tax=Streptacidiphilus fuscans TaxID=2789292 RepID=UPI002E2B32EF|nr:helix-turn-helix transcriptional regulator [Streptacidiphilus fuscans]